MTSPKYAVFSPHPNAGTWAPTVLMGAGPHTLIPGVINRYDNTANDAMVLHLPVATVDGEEVELLEVGFSPNNVVLTTALGTTDIVKPFPPNQNYSTSFNISGQLGILPSSFARRVWARYKWDANAGNWKLLGLNQPIYIDIPPP